MCKGSEEVGEKEWAQTRSRFTKEKGGGQTLERKAKAGLLKGGNPAPGRSKNMTKSKKNAVTGSKKGIISCP